MQFCNFYTNLIYICFSNYWEFTVHLICVKILPYARAIEKTSVFLECSSSSLIVEGVRIVHCDRLFAWIKMLLFNQKMQSSWVLFEPGCRVIRIPRQLQTFEKGGLLIYFIFTMYLGKGFINQDCSGTCRGIWLVRTGCS